MTINPSGRIETTPRLLRAARAGDRDAANELLAELAEALLPLAAALAGREHADDLLGDALSRVYERLGQLRDEGALVAWARTILVRQFRDGHRVKLRRRLVRIESADCPVPLATSAEVLDLESAVKRLPNDLRALLTLHYWAGYTLVECAGALDIAEGTAKSRLNRALSTLRAHLGGQRHDEP